MCNTRVLAYITVPEICATHDFTALCFRTLFQVQCIFSTSDIIKANGNTTSTSMRAGHHPHSLARAGCFPVRPKRRQVRKRSLRKHSLCVRPLCVRIVYVCSCEVPDPPRYDVTSPRSPAIHLQARNRSYRVLHAIRTTAWPE